MKIRKRVRDLVTSQKVKKVLQHKEHLANQRERFNKLENVVFVFQTFNKAEQMARIIEPILSLDAANIIVYADGCVDKSSEIAHNILSGKNHLVIASNDTHEIRNYRSAIAIAGSWNCKYAVLLQDDDLYNEKFGTWLNRVVRELDLDPTLAIVGGNGGANIGKNPPARADESLVTAKFTEYQSDCGRGYRLGKFEDMELPMIENSSAEPCPQYVATVNRAPQVVRIKSSIELGFFPLELEPYQYDDYYNAYTAWLSGMKVMLMPVTGKNSNIGVGGMRLYNSVGVESRPIHFVDNWNFIFDRFAEEMNSGAIMEKVKRANVELLRNKNGQ